MDAAALCVQGVTLFRAGEALSALPLLEAAFASRAGVSFSHPDELGKCALALGSLRSGISDSVGALEAFEVALRVFRGSDNRGLEGSTLNNMGLVYYAQGRYGEALTHYQQALAIAREVGDRPGEGTTLANLGAVYQRQKSYTEAQPYLEAAAGIIDSLRQGAGSSIARSSFIDRFADVYRDLVLNDVRLGLFGKAFLASERGRARTFLDEPTSGAVTLSDTAAGQLL